MMQLLPPSPAHLSLLSELFCTTDNGDNTNNCYHNELKFRETNPATKQLLPSLAARPELATPSFALRSASSTNPRAIRYQQPNPHQHHYNQDVLEDEEESPAPRSIVFREQPSHANPVRRCTRRRSPPQKILKTSNSFAVPARQLDERDENGNLAPSDGSLTCFSYRTMEQEYEQDTLRMLERIQKSRSFEKGNQQSNYNNEEGDVNGNGYDNANDHHDYNYEVVTMANDTSRDDHNSSFYIGDDDDDSDVDDFGFDGDTESSQGEPPLFEQEQEIFELDL